MKPTRKQVHSGHGTMWNTLWHREWQDNTVTWERERGREKKRGGDRGQKLQVLWTRLNEDKNDYEQD